MTKNWVESLHEMLANIGGAWITRDLITLFAEKAYVCRNCGLYIERGDTRCPHCNVKLIWRV